MKCAKFHTKVLTVENLLLLILVRTFLQVIKLAYLYILEVLN